MYKFRKVKKEVNCTMMGDKKDANMEIKPLKNSLYNEINNYRIY